jgi:hypothetical protein
MSDFITGLWEGMREAGMPEVMLYLADGSASRCHWDDTAVIGSTRVALLADQERGIVRSIPVAACAGIGLPSPKGVDPSGYRSTIQGKLVETYGGRTEPHEVGRNEPTGSGSG